MFTEVQPLNYKIMKTRIFKTEEAFNKAIEYVREKNYSYELWTEIESTSSIFQGAKYVETNEPIETWSGRTTAVYFEDGILETILLIII